MSAIVPVYALGADLATFIFRGRIPSILVAKRRDLCYNGRKISTERRKCMKVLILSCNTGQGHNTAGKAIQETTI